MTSETELKNERERLFNEWQALGEQIQQLGSIVQNPVEFVSHINYLDTRASQNALIGKFDKLWIRTDDYIKSNCENRWKENGELE